ncbi:MAG: nucleotidyl transferase AbiEii/AbiGii toxin family protein [Sphingobacteriales bacterium]|jgi:hypothetical protein
MTEFLQFPEDTRRELIIQVSAQKGMTMQAIEKDWWVTIVLKALFSMPQAPHFIFKGGTSLSKGWKLIERFSEDIDIALSPEAFGREYKIAPTHSYVKALKKEGCAFTNTVIKDALARKLIELGIPANLVSIEAEAVNVEMPDKDPQGLYVLYPSLFDPSAYIPNAVKVEFGVRSLREPFATVPIRSILAEETQSSSYVETPIPVTAVEPRKTFIEKLLLLHEKFQIGMVTDETGERQSRHLYDLRELNRKGIAEHAMRDTTLYALLLEHRRHYVRHKKIDYSKMELPALLFLPPQPLLEFFRKDYELMLVEMIYGEAPDFETMMQDLRALNLQLVATGHAKTDANEETKTDLRQINDPDAKGS